MAAETSVDAKVPVALALLKLSFKFSLKYFQEVSWLQNNNVYKAVSRLTKFGLIGKTIQEQWSFLLGTNKSVYFNYEQTKHASVSAYGSFSSKHVKTWDKEA